MSNIENHFVKPLAEFYGRNPFGQGFPLRLEPYAKTLSGEALQAVATKLIEKQKTFPSFAQCRDAIARADEAMTAPVSTAVRPWEFQKRDRYDWESRLKGIKLCRCPLGMTANQEGWLVSLIEFCEEKERMPNEREIPALVAKSRLNEEALERARGSPFYKSLVGWRANMLERAHKDVFGFEQSQAAE